MSGQKAGADEPVARYYVRAEHLHRKGGTCDCTVPCTEVAKAEAFDALLSQNERLREVLQHIARGTWSAETMADEASATLLATGAL